MRFALIAVFCAYLVIEPGAASDSKNPKLDATLWMQVSAEAKACALQTFGSASALLESAMAAPFWSACLEQGATRGIHLMPCPIIVDVDETVLDNSPYQARCVLDGASYAPDTWAQWVKECKAAAIPGAVTFLQNAASHGVTIFYLTNRSSELEEATRNNLLQAGFPLATDIDCVLTRNEKPDWTSDKTSRRRLVAATHRVLFLVGDDLGDFLPKAQRTPAQRRDATRQFASWWGKKWFMLPNPSYGSWERSLLKSASSKDLSPADLKLKHLDPRR